MADISELAEESLNAIAVGRGDARTHVSHTDHNGPS